MSRARPQGEKTALIGTLLKESIEPRIGKLTVHFDHGPDGVQPTAYMGRTYDSTATLSGMDIVITQRDQVVVAAEIEETPQRPKAVIGDTFAVVLSDGLKIRGKRYSLRGAELLLVVVTSKRGRGFSKLVRLQSHLNKYLKVLEASGRAKSIQAVRIILTSREDLVRRADRRIRWSVTRALKSARATTCIRR